MTFKRIFIITVCLAIIIGAMTTIFIYYNQPTVVSVSGLIAGLTEQELILNSDIIITGEVLELEKSKWTNPDNEIPERRNILQTDVIISIEELISGEYGEKTVAVRVDKGYDKKTNTQFVSDLYPEFAPGDRFLLFLSRDDSDIATDEDYFVLTGLIQGAFDLKDDGTVESYIQHYAIKTIPELKQRIAVEKQNNPDWKEKKAAEAERTRIENAKLFGE